SSPSFFFQAEDGIRYSSVTGVQTCALPISDDFKQCGADVVVQVFRREFFLAEAGKAGTDVGSELVQRVGIDSVGQHKSLRSVLEIGRASCRERVEICVEVGELEESREG